MDYIIGIIIEIFVDGIGTSPSRPGTGA